MSSDQRSQPRYDAVVPIRFRDAEDFLVQYTENISSGGVFIRTNNPPEVGTQLRMSLELPGTRTALPVTGEITFVVTPEQGQISGRTPGCGVRFKEVDPGTTQVLEQYVDSLSQKSRGSVLLVDDDTDILDVLTTVLRRARFNVIATMSAVNALQQIQYNDVDLVLSDLQMSRMDGFELYDALQQNERTQGVPFIIMSARVGDEERKIAKRLGIHACLSKPMDHTELVEVISQALASRSGAASTAAGPSRERGRKHNEIVFRKMNALGIDATFTADESGVEGTLRFKYVAIKNIVTGEQIFDAKVRSVGHDRLRFVEPPHLSNLRPIPILDLADGKAFEDAVRQVFKGRARWVEMGRKVLQKFRIPDAVSDPRFCAVGRVTIGADQVLVSVRDPKTLAVESVNGKALTDVVSASDLIVDIRQAESASDVEMAVETVVSRHRDALRARETQREAPAEGEWLGAELEEVQPEAVESEPAAPSPAPSEPAPPAPPAPSAPGVPPPPAPTTLGAAPPKPQWLGAPPDEWNEQGASAAFSDPQAVADGDLFGDMDELVGEVAEDELDDLSILGDDDLELLEGD